MFKVFLSLFSAIFLVIFATQNMDPVWVRFVFGPPVRMPIIVLMASSALVGYALAAINVLMRNRRDKKSNEGN